MIITQEIPSVGNLTFKCSDQTYRSPTLQDLDRVVGLKLDSKVGVIDLLGYVPEGWNTYGLSTYHLSDRQYGCNPDIKTVDLGHPHDENFLMYALHEIGHARDYDGLMKGGMTSNQIENIRYRVRERFESKVTLQDAMDYMGQEYVAWEFALSVVRPLSLPEEILKDYYSHIKWCLNTYLFTATDFDLLKILSKKEGLTIPQVRDQIKGRHQKWIEDHLN
ncbi:MAG: hypothetical protein WCV90_00945 [Candidatus Woesearchaeota archaeon]|jgi:hypothetical protein